MAIWSIRCRSRFHLDGFLRGADVVLRFLVMVLDALLLDDFFLNDFFLDALCLYGLSPPERGMIRIGVPLRR